MELHELLSERRRLYDDQDREIRAVRESYRLKLDAINSQIKRATQKGVKHRINEAMRKKSFA